MLRLVMLNDAEQNLDPDKEYYAPTWELFRCCLLRTLLSYNGEPTENGGSSLFPDLADGMPEISTDGLTWTFHIRRGIHYAPPFSNVEVTAQDFIRALNREADPVASTSPGYPKYYEIIAGFKDAESQTSPTGPQTSMKISGLHAPDPYTLVVTLNEETGDLGYRFSLPATAPIPPSPIDQSYPEGAAQGLEEDYGHHLISTGPYMLEGSDQLDFTTQPFYMQQGVAGYEAGRSITLVRNPSWDPSTDPLRPAYVDGIDIRVAPNRLEWSPFGTLDPKIQALGRQESEHFTNEVETGTLDLVFDTNAPESQVGPDTPSDGSNTLRYLSMNLAVPPFDDPHVRVAVNYAIKKGPLVAALNGLGLEGQPASHLAPDSLEANLLADYDPYPPSLSKARHQMALSGYDANGDGSCDYAACRSVTFESQSVGTEAAQNRWISLVQTDLDGIGIHLAAVPSSSQSYPPDHLGLRFGAGAFSQADYPSAPPFFATLFASWSIVGNAGFRTPNPNFSLLGATPDDLRLWGYATHHVPSLDPWIAACQPEIGEAQARCWAETDQYLMQQVVPAVPISFDQTVRVISGRVRNYSIDQFTGLPALDHLAVAG